MSNWEYRILEILKSSSRLELRSVDGRSIEERSRPTPDKNGFDLHTYLNAVGQECWEMVGCSPAEGTGEELNFITFLIFLKRPV
jgi:hypothetical protein